MSLTARLHIAGHEKETDGLEIYTCDFGFTQEIEFKTLSSISMVRPGLINLTMPSINDAEIVQWMFTRFAAKNGKISFKSPSDSGIEQEYKTLKFENAFLVSYHENYTEDSTMILSLSILANKIILSDNEWTGHLGTDEIS